MQRQSLGSPAPKLHIHGALKIDNNTLLTNNLPSPSLYPDDDQGHKATKPRRFSSASASSSSLSPSISFSSTHPEKLIHLVPLLTLFCFLVLFLVSHHPTQTDLSQFNGFKQISSRLDLPNEIIDEISGANEIESTSRGDILSIRSVRNLQQEMSGGGTSLKSPSHRKLADF